MRSATRRRSWAETLAGGIVALGVLANANLLTIDDARADADPSGPNISVTVTDGRTPAPTAVPSNGSGSPSPGSTGSGASGGSGGAAPSDAATPAEAPTSAQQSSDELSIGGVLYLSGLEGSSTPSIDPTAGSVHLSFTVRNASHTAFDSEARFWIETPFGTRLGTVVAPVEALQAGEVRTIGVELSGIGQWPIVNARVTLTPPTEIEGTELTPLTRETTVFAFPWAVGLVAALGIAAAMLARVVRGRRPAIPEPEPQGAVA
ncbi:hypothetical protein ACDF64_06890 [Agromyces sp. MMS24-JH15]|uniref:hypothetical protein n=1 Tax=Agromyces sp. MMS24-JH15 TaxID=3243765 RepID=UPI003748977F